MRGTDRDGAFVDYTPRTRKRAVPPGPLSARQVRDLQATLARGLVALGYTAGHAGQVLNLPRSTVARRLEPDRPGG